MKELFLPLQLRTNAKLDRSRESTNTAVLMFRPSLASSQRPLLLWGSHPIGLNYISMQWNSNQTSTYI